MKMLFACCEEDIILVAMQRESSGIVTLPDDYEQKLTSLSICIHNCLIFLIAYL